MASLAPYSGVLGKRLAAHLLRRATYAPSKSQIDAFTTKTATQAVDDLLVATSPTVPEPIDWKTGQEWINCGTMPPSCPTTGGGSSTNNKRHFTRGWWINEAMLDTSLGHKMQFFLHTCFVIDADFSTSEAFFDYLGLLRHYAFGNYEEFAVKMTLDNLMMKYLNNDQNDTTNPNENYARELLELFTIGKGPQIGPGNYTTFTEDDVVAAARVLTGWNKGKRDTDIDPDTNLPTSDPAFWKHDQSPKAFSSAFQNTIISPATSGTEMYQEIADMMAMIFNQDATAQYLVRKLYRFFVKNEINTEIENDIIMPLASVFKLSGYNLGTAIGTLLKSEHFYDQEDLDPGDEVIGALIKSPLDLFAGAMTLFEVPVPDPYIQSNAHYYEFYLKSIVNNLFSKASFNIFSPDVVAGYPAFYQEPEYSRHWFDSTTIIARYKLPEMLITGKRVLIWGDFGTQMDIVPWISANISLPSSASILVSELLSYMLPETPTSGRMTYFLDDIFLNGLDPLSWYYEWQNYLSTNDDSAVRIPLENLITAIMYSPEYQLM